MSTHRALIVGKLEDNVLWQEACAIAEYMYGILHEFPEEEKWDTERKLRSAANDVMYYVAQAVANGLPASAEYDWANARKSVSTVKTLYRFAGRQKMIEFDPETMVRLDKLLATMDNETTKAYENTEEYNRQELARLRKHYELSRDNERKAGI